MPWQDMVFTVGNIIFAGSLIPSILSDDKPSVWTSFPTAAFLYLFAYTYITMSLWGSAFAIGLVAICWTILAIQKYFIDRKKS